MKCTRLLVCLTLLLLAACGGQVRHVFPPAATIQQLSAPPEGAWTATLRLHNQSYDADVRFEHVRLSLKLADIEAGELDQDIALDVAERSSDVTDVKFTPSQAARDKLASENAQLHYSITGSVTLSNEGKHPRDFDIDHDGWLSPVPGVAHMYR